MNKEFTSGYAPVNGLESITNSQARPDERKTTACGCWRGGRRTRFKTPLGTCLPAVARDRQIIAFEQARLWAHSGIIAERPFSFEQSADDRDRTARTISASIGGRPLGLQQPAARVAAPTLVVGSDRGCHCDLKVPSNCSASLPHAQLAILPRTEHMEITTRTSWLVPMINEFLDAEMPKTM